MVVPMKGPQLEVLLQCGAQNLYGAAMLIGCDGVGRLGYSVFVDIFSGLILKIYITGNILYVQLESRSCLLYFNRSAYARSEFLVESFIPPGERRMMAGIEER